MLALFQVPFGTGSIDFELPEDRTYILNPPEFEGLVSQDIAAVTEKVQDACRNPIGSSPLRSMVKRGQKVAIIVDDWSRPTPVSLLLPGIISEMAGVVRDEDISLVYATGAHVGTLQQAKDKIGPDLSARFRVVVHDSNDSSMLVYVGETSRHTPLYINRTVAEADFVIGVGNITPHSNAGYGGGAKIILPGVSGLQTINANHMLMCSEKARMGNLVNNPARDDIEEAAQIAKLSFVVNTVLTGYRYVHSIVAGDPIKAHRAGVATVIKVHGVEVPRLADVAIVGMDWDNQQSVAFALRGLLAADYVVKDGGTIIIVAPCEQGWASKEYVESLYVPPFDLLTYPTDEIIHEAMRRSLPVRLALWAYNFKRVTDKKMTILVSEGALDSAQLRTIGVVQVGTMAEALTLASEGCRDAVYAVIPQGASILPLAGPVVECMC